MKIWNLGYPRLGPNRELKTALEENWKKETSPEQFLEKARAICGDRWIRQHELGVESIPVNDFSFYDHMLDMSWLLGEVPSRFAPSDHWVNSYFQLARGGKSIAPLSMTKWFNTNYHYFVPEISKQPAASPRWEKLLFELELCRNFPFRFHPVLIGPFTFVRLSRLKGISSQEAVEKLLPNYIEILKELKKRRFDWVQIDEPILGHDITREQVKHLRKTYDLISKEGPQVMLATYFENPDPWWHEVASLPVSGMHFDLTRGIETLRWFQTLSYPKDRFLSLGAVNGKNIWVSPLAEYGRKLADVVRHHGSERVWLAPSCSLIHLPVDVERESHWEPEFRKLFAFADQRLTELRKLRVILSGGSEARKLIEENEAVLASYRTSKAIANSEVKQAVERIDLSMKRRPLTSKERRAKQVKGLGLPKLPTSTIGSFPQDHELREARRHHLSGSIDDQKYLSIIEAKIAEAISLQEEVGIDILTHGEFERTDMVEYFAENLQGFRLSKHGWVQSYGSRCVKPPILFGDVKRKKNITTEWFLISQKKTKKIVKAVLTGPVTLLNWSFVRDDQPREKTCYQLALAVREEVRALESAGARVIQVDEPALRECLPMKKVNWNQYLRWAVDCFLIATSGVNNETMIQTHMCYSEIQDILSSILRMDADVYFIENARREASAGESFNWKQFDGAVGPGIFDVHSPTIPQLNELEQRLTQLMREITPERLWVVPDCGLKTRSWAEVRESLQQMVAAAKKVRSV